MNSIHGSCHAPSQVSSSSVSVPACSHCFSPRPLAAAKYKPSGDTAQGRGEEVLVRAQQDLSRNRARLLGLRPQAVRSGQAGLPLRQSGRHSVQGAGSFRRADPQEGNAGHDRRLRHARPGQGALQRGARSLQSQPRVRRPGQRLRAVLARRALARSRAEDDRRTAGPSSSQRTATTAPSPAPAAARSAPSPPRGSARMRSTASSARSEPTSACAAATSIRP